MDRMMVVGCGYRTWALRIFDYICRQSDIQLTTIQSEKNATMETISFIDPVLVLFYGWSWRVPDEILERYPCLCLHPSPLPKYRGGSPLQNQIMEGETVSAVSIFRMTHEMDAGDLCCQEGFSLEGDLWDVFGRITEIGKMQTLRILREWPDVRFWPQDGEPTVYARRQPEESEITQDELTYGTARFLYNKIRSLQVPYPNAFITCADGQRLYITEASCEE